MKLLKTLAAVAVAAVFLFASSPRAAASRDDSSDAATRAVVSIGVIDSKTPLRLTLAPGKVSLAWIPVVRSSEAQTAASAQASGIKAMSHFDRDGVTVDLWATLDAIDVSGNVCEQLKSLKGESIGSYRVANGREIRIDGLPRLGTPALAISVGYAQRGAPGVCPESCCCYGVQCCPSLGNCLECGRCGFCCNPSP